MATRGALGGLARATGDAVDVLDAAGYDLVLVETVGVGQDEVDIVKAADTIAVVLVPGLGDDIQAIKAGILEIADVFVVNKADREGADRTAAEIAAMLDFTPDRPWRPPIVRTIAPRGEGIEAVVEAIASHESFLRETAEGELRRERRARERVRQRLQERFRRDVETAARGPQGLEEAIREVLARREDPYSAADRIYGRLVRA
jgi:LAO/AO transport system kinase